MIKLKIYMENISDKIEEIYRKHVKIDNFHGKLKSKMVDIKTLLN